MKTSVVTMLASLLTSKNLTFIGKMNLIFTCLTILFLELVDCTILINNKNEDIFVELDNNLWHTVELYGNSFLVIMHAVDHYITLNGPIQMASLGRMSALKIEVVS